MLPMPVLYSVILSFIFKDSNFLLSICCETFHRQRKSLAILSRQVRLSKWSFFHLILFIFIIVFTPLLWRMNGVCWQAVCTFVRTNVRPATKCTITYYERLNLEAPIFAHTCMLTMYLCLPIFIQIINVPDLQFQDQIFESNTLASAYGKST